MANEIITALTQELASLAPADPVITNLRDALKRHSLACECGEGEGSACAGTSLTEECRKEGFAHQLSVLERQDLSQIVDFAITDGALPVASGEALSLATVPYKEPWTPGSLSIVLKMANNDDNYENIDIVLSHGGVSKRYRGDFFMKVGRVQEGSCCADIRWPFTQAKCLGPESTVELEIEHSGPNGSSALTSVRASFILDAEPRGDGDLRKSC